MKVEVKRITDPNLFRECAEMTTGKECKMSWNRALCSGHSIIRAQEYLIKMYDIPLCVASHLVRHVHSQPYQRSKRPDRDPDAVDLGRMTPTDLALKLNAEEIINISKVRLCSKASEETREVWSAVVREIDTIDRDLANHCRPTCVFRGGICPEIKSCGFNKTALFQKQLHLYKLNFVK